MVSSFIRTFQSSLKSARLRALAKSAELLLEAGCKRGDAKFVWANDATLCFKSDDVGVLNSLGLAQARLQQVAAPLAHGLRRQRNLNDFLFISADVAANLGREVAIYGYACFIPYISAGIVSIYNQA